MEIVLRALWYRGIVHVYEILATLLGVLFLFGMLTVAIPVGYVRTLGRGPQAEAIWNDMFRTIVRWYLAVVGIHISIEGAEHFPYGQPAVLALNHPSILDGPLVDMILRGRPTTALTAPFKYFPWPISFWFLKVGGIEVARSPEEEVKYPSAFSGGAAITEGVRRIKDLRQTLFVFPEGHTEKIHHPLPFKTGALRIAIAAQVPLIPVTLKGSERVFTKHHLLRPGTLHVIFHEAMTLPDDPKAVRDKNLINILTSQLLCRIAQDLDMHYYTPGMVLACQDVLAWHPVTSKATGLTMAAAQPKRKSSAGRSSKKPASGRQATILLRRTGKNQINSKH